MKEQKKKLTTRTGAPVVDNQNIYDRRAARPATPAGCLVPGETGPL